MLNKSFNASIRKIINTIAFPMYIIMLDDQKCTCIDFHDIPDKNCPYCLGIGHRIRIKKITGAMEPDEVSVRLSGQQQKTASSYYYFDANLVPERAIREGNYIVRDNEVDILQSPKKYRSDSNDVIYYYVEGVIKKTNTDIFLKNFYKLVSQL